ncbi:MAG: Asp-tRNA(Asn)/Glu-tRNA(Gln) amidotransferase subunit GatC [Ignavibacteriales bacterium]|nr:Asp-tRNA(Asn)/Glu-tRNA(Gln) amidotransferase subunit GatC [Ignavibacteriales bacterium]
MSVTLKDVDHIAKLARLEFTDEEKATFTHQLNSILAYVEQLNKLDTTNVEPLAHVIELEDAFRVDVVRPGVSQEDALKNAPAKNEKFFKVPKVIGDH